MVPGLEDPERDWRFTADFGAYQLENDGVLPITAEHGIFTFDKARFKGENTALTVNGRLTLLKKWDLFLNGEADLSLISFFSKEIAAAKGKAVLDLTVTDAWKEPHIRGQLTLRDGRVVTQDPKGAGFPLGQRSRMLRRKDRRRREVGVSQADRVHRQLVGSGEYRFSQVGGEPRE